VNRLGTFAYNSLGDLQAGIPISFTRTLAPRERESSMLVGAISLGDSYRRTTRLQFQYGVRVDANQYLDAPARNTEVERLLGVRNDRVPNGVFVSPRVGFSWQYGTGPQIGAFDGACRGAWRHRSVSEHPASHADRFGHRQHGAGQRHSAAGLRGGGHAKPRLERLQ
jgi:hypothetical protein